jgi:hypothetical protein
MSTLTGVGGRAFRTNKRLCFMDFSDEVGPAFFNPLDNGEASISLAERFMEDIDSPLPKDLPSTKEHSCDEAAAESYAVSF